MVLGLVGGKGRSRGVREVVGGRVGETWGEGDPGVLVMVGP